MAEIEGTAERAVELAERLGADEAEAYIVKSTVSSVSFSDRIEMSRASNHGGIGVRAIVDKRLGFHSVSSLRDEAIEEAVRGALKVAQASPRDPEWVQLPDRLGSASVEGVYCEETAKIEPARLVEAAGLVIDTIQDCDRRVSPTRGFISASVASVSVCNTYGGEMTREGTHASFSVNVKAEGSVKKGTSTESRDARSWRRLRLEELSVKAARRAVAMIDARPIAGGECPVVLRNDVSARVVSLMFARTLTAEAVQRRRSPWSGKLGARIASENLTLADDGVLRGGIGTESFDGEGFPQQKTPLISRGVLQGFLYDSYTANKEKRASTGNARRLYTSIPRPGVTNLVVSEGDADAEELVAETRRGLYVSEVIGEWLSNPMSGYLSATVTNGFLIRDGELAEPVKGVIISGNFFDILQRGLEVIGDDVENSGRCYCPSLKIASMTIAGD